MSLSGLFIASFLFACGEKAGGPAAAGAAKGLPSGADVPDDANSKAFARALVSSNTSNFSPTDAPGAKFRYTSLQFRGDNTWVASGYVEAMDERMECVESGSWTMNPADSPTKATMSWALDKTNCAGREAGESTRVQVTLGSGKISEALFR
jgi:hypothetical protein